jgi:metacaspase-1
MIHVARPLLLLTPLAAALLAVPTQADDRALLVGIGRFSQAPDLNLKGIDIDVDTMQTVAQELGYAPAQTRVLRDGEATLAAVQEALRVWVRGGVGPEDRVLIYFSTHGTQVPDRNGDEQDKVDEALLMNDVATGAGPDGVPTLTQVLLDDDLEQALAAIPSRNVLVLIDACHSGTVTRGIGLRSLRSGTKAGEIKFYAYPGMPKAAPSGLARQLKDGLNYASLAAAADDESSIATERGSLFTQAVAQTVRQALDDRDRGELTAKRIKDGADTWLASALGPDDKDRLFHPQLGGNPALFDKPLRLVRTDAGHGPLWGAVRDRAGQMAPLAIRANRASLRAGEQLELTVQVPRDGWLNVVGIDPKDRAIVAFPNAYHRDNRVQAGEVKIPGELAFDLPASPPYGPTLLVAFFTDQPASLYDSADGPRDDKGQLQMPYPPPSHAGLRGFLPTPRSVPSGAAGAVEVSICRAVGCP